MFPPKKKPVAPMGASMGKPKPPMGGGGKFGGSGMGGGPKPKSPMDDLESPDPVEGKMDDGPDMEDDSNGDMGDMPDMSAGSGYGAKLEKDIADVGAALGMEPGQAKKAAGAFFAAAAQCLSGGDEGGEGDDGSGGDEMIDTGSAGPGRYGQ